MPFKNQDPMIGPGEQNRQQRPHWAAADDSDIEMASVASFLDRRRRTNAMNSRVRNAAAVCHNAITTPLGDFRIPNSVGRPAYGCKSARYKSIVQESIDRRICNRLSI